MNTPPIAPPERYVVHVAKTSDEFAKDRFIHTCDAMLHARSSGETFGLAVGEFSARNRPVFTSREHTDHGAARMHLDVLGRKGHLYSTKDELVGLLLSLRREAGATDHNAYRAYEPQHVLRAFEATFLVA